MTLSLYLCPKRTSNERRDGRGATNWATYTARSAKQGFARRTSRHWDGLRCWLFFPLCQTSPPPREFLRKTEVRDYRVYGKTPGQLVSYMKRRPFRGDNGPAMANIRPRYNLTTATTKNKRGCKIKRLNLNVRFIMTLPKSMDKRKQSKKTQNVWRSFRKFTQRHEERHRKIYMRCARDFVRAATAIAPMRSCRQLKNEIKKRLKAHEKACDQKHLAFDRREFRRVPLLPLFRHARQEKKRVHRSVRKRKSKPQKSWLLKRN